jgi:hypothetical protein
VTESGLSGIHRISVFDVSTSTTGFLRAFGGDVAAPPDGAGSPFEICPTDGSCLQGEPFGGAGAFNFPADAAIDSVGNLYVADSINQRIDVFNAATASVTFTRAFGRDVLAPDGDIGFENCASGFTCIQGDTGTGPGEMSFPSDVAVDCRGAIWVSEPPGNRLQRFGEPGTPLCPLAPASLGVAPTTKDFGSTQVGTPTAATQFTVTNNGEVTSGSLSVSLTGANASQFGITQDNCTGQTLGELETCSVFARFAPSSAGLDKAANLDISGTPGGLASAALSGDATAVPTPPGPIPSPSLTTTPGLTGQRAAALKKCKKKKGAARKKCKKRALKLPL